MNLLKRSYFGWGGSGARSANPTKGIVIHYDGPGQRLTSKSHRACISYWKSVRKFHMNTNGWADIGYSYGVCPHSDSSGKGYVLEGRGLRKEQAAQPGGNTTYYSVTLMLGEGEKPTDVQIKTVRELRAWLRGKGVGAEVKGHKDFISTSCPGSILYKMVKDGTFSKGSPAKSNSWPFSGNFALGKTDRAKYPTQTKKVQKRLNDLGYKPKLAVDGDFYVKTEKAVKWFQKKKGIKVDGLVGKVTWGKLFP